MGGGESDGRREQGGSKAEVERAEKLGSLYKKLRQARSQTGSQTESSDREYPERAHETLSRNGPVEPVSSLASQFNPSTLLQVAFAHVTDAVVIVDADATVCGLNPVAERLTGWTEQAAWGRGVAEVICLLAPLESHSTARLIPRVLHSGEPVSLADQSILVQRTGEPLPVVGRIVPIADKAGPPQGAMLLFRDASERQRIEGELLSAKEEAEAANRTKTEFLATMSHELRTPPSIVLGYTELLAEGEFGRLLDAQADTLQRITRSAHELLDLITAVLDVGRLDTGQMPVDMKEINPSDLLQEVKTETQDLEKQSGLKVVWRVNPDLPIIHTDPWKLKVIVKNLIGNAVKFTESGEVKIDAQASGEGVEIRVEDTGIGIPQDSLAELFEPFRQLKNTSTRHLNGTGLGLHIVRRLLDLVGGQVAVESEVGRGSTFCVWVRPNLTNSVKTIQKIRMYPPRPRGCLESRGTRHCERSEAICNGKRDCFVA